MNWSIQSSLWDFVFRSSGYAPRRGSAGSYSYCFLFLRRYYCFYSNHALCIPTISVQGPRSLHVLTDHSGLTAAAWWVWGAASRVLAVASAPSHAPVNTSLSALEKRPFQSLAPFWITLIVLLLLLSCSSSFYILDLNPLSYIWLHAYIWLHWFYRLLWVLAFNNIKSSKPQTWAVSLCIHVIFNFSHQCFVVFIIQVFHCFS